MRLALVVSILLVTNYFSVYALDKSAINSNDELYGDELVARRAYLYRDVLIKAYCADGGGKAIATRVTVALNAPMASIHYEVYKIHDSLQGFEIMQLLLILMELGTNLN